MSRYSTMHKEPKKRNENPHAVWRGIGCLSMILIPLVAIAAADVLYTSGLLPFAFTNELFEGWAIPGTDYYLRKGVLLVAGFIAFGLYGVLAVLNAAIYQANRTNTAARFDTPYETYKPKKKLKRNR